MKSLRFIIVVMHLAVVCGGITRSQATSSQAPESQVRWKSLFDGKTLKGWAATGKREGWAVEDGAIACTVKGGGYLYTRQQFDDFVLSVDFKIDRGVNSGIFFRWSNIKDPVNTGIEFQVLDSFDKTTPGNHDCGAIYDIVAPRKQACKPAGEWNNAVITCNKSRIQVEVNGERVVDMNLDEWTTPGMNPDGAKNKFKYAYKDLPRKGRIGFQDHGGKVWYRNIKIQNI